MERCPGDSDERLCEPAGQGTRTERECIERGEF